MKKLILLAIILSFSSSFCFAAKVRKAKKVRKSEINFESDNIRGEINKPDLIHLSKMKEINYGNLIDLRENFLTEMEATGEFIQQGR